MGKHRTPEERLAHAETLVARYQRMAERFMRRRKRLHAKRDKKGAQKAKEGHERAERVAHKWQRVIHKVEKQIKMRETLMQRAPVVPKPVEENLSPAQQRQREKERKAYAQREEAKRKKLAASKVVYDSRTAVGSRNYDVVNFGAKMRATNDHFSACAPRRSDRTDTRLLAWQEFDRHYHKVQAGVIANPRYEPGVDTSTIPDVSEYRLAALKADAELRRDIGPHAHHILVEVVYHQRHPRDLPGLSALEPAARTVLLLHALDLAAIYWRLDQVRKVRHRHSQIAIDPAPAD